MALPVVGCAVLVAWCLLAGDSGLGGQVTSCWWTAGRGGAAMTGLLVCAVAVAGDGARPAVGVVGPLAAQHREREPVCAVADGDQGDQRRLAAGQQPAPVDDEIGVV